MPNILAYLGNISVALYMEEVSVESSVKEISVTLCVATSSILKPIVKLKVKQSTNKKLTKNFFPSPL